MRGSLPCRAATPAPAALHALDEFVGRVDEQAAGVGEFDGATGHFGVRRTEPSGELPLPDGWFATICLSMKTHCFLGQVLALLVVGLAGCGSGAGRCIRPLLRLPGGDAVDSTGRRACIDARRLGPSPQEAGRFSLTD